MQKSRESFFSTDIQKTANKIWGVQLTWNALYTMQRIRMIRHVETHVGTAYQCHSLEPKVVRWSGVMNKIVSSCAKGFEFKSQQALKVVRAM